MALFGFEVEIYWIGANMDPATAFLNAYTATLALVTAIVNKAPSDVVGDIITKHEARMDKIWAVIGKLPGPLHEGN